MSSVDQSFGAFNHNKANFDAIYTAPDPREYFRVLCGLDYVIPDLAKGVFRSLIQRCAKWHNRRVRVLDIGCSYGVNAALIRFPLDIQRLAERYVHPRMHSLQTETIIDLDRHYFSSWPEQVAADFVGLDCSKSAIGYATKVGLIDVGVSRDLERFSVAPAEVESLDDIDMIISTGCVGYVSQKTFQRILDLRRRPGVPWLANFVLRVFPFEPIADELKHYGLITEKLEGVTFVQRRFHSRDEFEATLSALRARDIDPTGKETEGLLHAELFVSRPPEDAAALPLAEMVSVTSGGERSYGQQYHMTAARSAELVVC
jgi:SAM-dependent methyltransferase